MNIKANNSLSPFWCIYLRFVQRISFFFRQISHTRLLALVTKNLIISFSRFGFCWSLYRHIFAHFRDSFAGLMLLPVPCDIWMCMRGKNGPNSWKHLASLKYFQTHSVDTQRGRCLAYPGHNLWRFRRESTIKIIKIESGVYLKFFSWKSCDYSQICDFYPWKTQSQTSCATQQSLLTFCTMTGDSFYVFN